MQMVPPIAIRKVLFTYTFESGEVVSLVGTGGTDARDAIEVLRVWISVKTQELEKLPRPTPTPNNEE